MVGNSTDSGLYIRSKHNVPEWTRVVADMGRGVSSGGGQSSLGYLFGGGEVPKHVATSPLAVSSEVESAAPPKQVSPPAEVTKQIPAGIHSTSTNNYLRSDGQNTGNFLTERPSTKVHSAPGGGSSLDYLFGGAGK